MRRPTCPKASWAIFFPNHSKHCSARIAVRVTKDGEAITFDFTGTDRQQRGNVNAVEAVTLSAVAWSLRSVTDPSIPANGGALRPLTLVAPPGSKDVNRFAESRLGIS